MATLWGIITGLGVLVTDSGVNPRSAHTLLLQPVQSGTPVPPTSTGVGVPAHQPRLRVRGTGPDISVSNQDIVLPGSPGNAVLVDGNLLLPLGRELRRPALALNPALFDPGNATKMVFTGGTLRPIQVQRNFNLNQFSLDVNLRLEAAHDIETGNRIPLDRHVANGLLYSRLLDASEVPTIHVNGVPHTPELVSGQGTGALPVGDEDMNYVFWISNTAQASSVEPFDRDFYLLYNWLLAPPPIRYVPVILPHFFDNPPGQCMFSYGTS